jgi:hypothetical protein
MVAAEVHHSGELLATQNRSQASLQTERSSQIEVLGTNMIIPSKLSSGRFLQHPHDRIGVRNTSGFAVLGVSVGRQFDDTSGLTNLELYRINKSGSLRQTSERHAHGRRAGWLAAHGDKRALIRGLCAAWRARPHSIARIIEVTSRHSSKLTKTPSIISKARSRDTTT